MATPDIFKATWPEGLEANKRYEVQCDDDGHLCDASMYVMVDDQGDAYVGMHKYLDEERGVKNLNPFPSIRIRTFHGGGRMRRTRQALLWLARAIALDSADGGALDPEDDVEQEELLEDPVTGGWLRNIGFTYHAIGKYFYKRTSHATVLIRLTENATLPPSKCDLSVVSSNVSPSDYKDLEGVLFSDASRDIILRILMVMEIP